MMMNLNTIPQSASFCIQKRKKKITSSIGFNASPCAQHWRDQKHDSKPTFHPTQERKKKSKSDETQTDPKRNRCLVRSGDTLKLRILASGMSANGMYSIQIHRKKSCLISIPIGVTSLRRRNYTSTTEKGIIITTSNGCVSYHSRLFRFVFFPIVKTEST